MSQQITTEELKKLLDSNEKFHLVNVLSPDSFSSWHIPGSINVPLGDTSDFLENFSKIVNAEKSDFIVVHCSGPTCGASPQAQKMLTDAGYTNVQHYKDGIQGWENAGYDFESTD